MFWTKLVKLVGVAFFFSSRRRHTRSYGDWSSDVCSSDLVFNQSFCISPTQDVLIDPTDEAQYLFGVTNLRGGKGALRSEERRVGKECRSRWSADHEKKNRISRRATLEH